VAWLTDAGDGWHSPGALESGATRPRETVRGAASFHRPTNCSKSGGESGIVFRPISEITATMEKSFYPSVIADTFEIAAMKLDIG